MRRYISPENVKLEVRFAGYTPDEVKHELASILDENGRNMSMNVLAALEAAFRIDFIQRVKDGGGTSCPEIFGACTGRRANGYHLRMIFCRVGGEPVLICNPLCQS